MYRKRQSNDRQARNRIQVLNRIIERPALEQRLVDVREGAAEQNGVAVRTGTGDRGGTQRTTAAADVFDDHRAEQRFDLFHPWPREGVERATRRKWNHEPDRPRRIGLRPRETRHGRQRSSARCEMEKISAGKFRVEPPFTSFYHLVGAQHERGWHLEADRLRGLQVDRQLEPRWLLDWDGTDLFAAKDCGQLPRQLPEHLGDARTIAD